jgi:hypothetical protein
MRVIECNECGETISAANDEEPDEDEVADLVHEQAYDASDS